MCSGSDLVKDRLLLFVHGLGGAGQATWRDRRYPGFAELISADGALRELAEAAFFEYPTSLLRLPFSRIPPRIGDLAEGLRSQIEVRYPEYKSIALICHSLGGLVARKYLIEEVKQEGRLRVDKLLLFAVPNNVPASLCPRDTYLGSTISSLSCVVIPN